MAAPLILGPHLPNARPHLAAERTASPNAGAWPGAKGELRCSQRTPNIFSSSHKEGMTRPCLCSERRPRKGAYWLGGM